MTVGDGKLDAEQDARERRESRWSSVQRETEARAT